MNKDIFYDGHPLKLILFHGSPCLWINYPEQREIPKMEFVGGYPTEWCIYIHNLTEEERRLIKDKDGKEVVISQEFDERDSAEVAEAIKKYTNFYTVREGIFNRDSFPQKLQDLFDEELKARKISQEEIETIIKTNG